MKVASVVGARPQFIKLGMIDGAIGALNNRGVDRIDHQVIHTGQHYDANMSQCFFDELGLPAADVNLGIGSGSHGEQTGQMLSQLDRWLDAARPDVVLTYGDTNSTLAAALAAAKLHIPVAHVESGLRSRNKSMPEEINRVLTDHASMFLFCPTKTAVRNLQQEGFSNPLFEGELAPLGFEEPDRIASVDAPWVVNVGDVMYDSVLQHVCRAKARGFTDPTLRSLAVNHAVLTVHRADNTDNAKLLRSILEAAQSIAQDGIAVFFPIHPRTRQAIKRASLDSLLAGLMSVEPVSYYDMLLLVQRAEFVLTDSGGLQREAFMLGTPCVTLRRETEWVELLDTGISELGGTDPKEILDAVDRVRGATVKGPVSPYGDGHAAQRIMAAVSTWWRDAAT